ncbi:MAG: hypothetical protein R3E01_35195 [Pirellulaceae bacterium]|nr:hypothetical protein [Planctomycetales bacterium]
MKYLITILGLAIFLAVFDAWCAARRSLIPYKLNGEVTAKELRPEKHPGEDDVCLIETTDHGWIHIDSTIYPLVSVGDNVTKKFGSRTLTVNDGSERLEWSQDVDGMLVVLPTTTAIAVVLTVLAARRRRGSARNQ